MPPIKRTTPFGRLYQAPASQQTDIAFEPLGLDLSQPINDIPVGASSSGYNLYLRDGGLRGRPMLRHYPNSSTDTILPGPILGGTELVSVIGTPTQVISNTTNWAYYSNGSWSRLSYVSAGGVSDPPSLSTAQFWNFTQIYDPNSDENLAVAGVGSYQSLYCTKSESTLFSTLTSAPRARFVASYDNYLVAFNVRDSSSASTYVQRVQWSDRGNPSNWTTGLSGFEDLLDMKGAGTRVINDGRRLLLFSDEEIWQGLTAAAPFTFQFSPVVRFLGCPYGRTVARTPIGVIFLSRYFQVYLLPADGGVPIPIGQKITPLLRTQLGAPERAWAVYDGATRTYQLYYVLTGTTTYPTYSLWFHIDSGEWLQQRYDTYSNGNVKFEMPCGWAGQLATATSGLVWSDLSGVYTWTSLPYTWSQMLSSTDIGAPVIFTAGSGGTTYYHGSDLNYSNEVGVYSPNFEWTSGVVGGQEPTRVRRVTQVDLDYERTAGDTSMKVTVKAPSGSPTSFQTRTMGSASGDPFRQKSFWVDAATQNPLIQLTGAPMLSSVKRITVHYRLGGTSYN